VDGGGDADFEEEGNGGGEWDEDVEVVGDG
jgi:hypothetical protein